MPDRYYLKNGKPVDMGVPLTPEMVDGAIYRGYRSVRDNNQTVNQALADFRPLMEKAAALNEATVGPELQQLLKIREQLNMQPAIVEALRKRGL